MSQNNTSYGVRPARFAFVLPLLLVSASALTLADVTNITGSITSSETVSRYGFTYSIGVQVQGTNFSLSGNVFDSLVNFTATAQTATFNPTVSRTEVAPLISCCPPGSNNLQLVYNSIAYTNINLVLNFTGASALVPNTFQRANQDSGGLVTNVPFSMTGVVSVYSTAPPFTGTPLFSVPFSGSGNYTGSGFRSYPGSGTSGDQGQVAYQFLPSPTAFTTDSTTQGAWNGKYGGEGYLIPNGPISMPGYAAVQVARAFSYTWSPQTTEARALQNGLGSNTGIASAYTTYYGQTLDINVNFTDSYAHHVALYLLDFDSTTRLETITITDSNTGAVLDTETLSNFYNGVYANWNLRGAVKISVKSSGGTPVVSGIFFGPGGVLAMAPPVASSGASFWSTDSNTKGAWSTRYGNAGYMIANGPSSAPTQATTNVSGAFTYTWAGLTSDLRALQSAPNATTGIASAYTQYPGSSFSINVNTSPNSRQLVTLYLLDWDNAGRTETITISDLSTNAVLDTRTVSGFQGGQYLSWLVGGNVVIKVTQAAGSGPVVSGVFFN